MIVVAHRALALEVAGRPGRGTPENTPLAIRAAAAAGADAVELDVRRTRDGALVLAHDPVVRVGGRWWRPRVVSWTSRGALGALAGLEEALSAAATLGLSVRLDVKKDADLATVVAEVRACGTDLTEVAVWCRSADAISDLAARGDLDGVGEVALLSDTTDTTAYADAARACGATAVSLHPDAIDEAAVVAAHDRGLRVYAWILDPDRHQVAVDLGVDGLVTDWVQAARAVTG